MPTQLHGRQEIISCYAAATLSAYRVVSLSGLNTVALYTTSTSLIFGVSATDTIAASTSVAIVVGGPALVACGASVSAGAVVAVQTATGLIVEALHISTSTSSAIPKLVGVAMQAGSTNAVIEVMLQINNHSKVAF